MTAKQKGLAAGMNPPQFLQVGDEMRLGIEGLGEQTQKVVSRD
jgi:2,4-diketo-3-deoxy-L-fuconate hydrolase